MSMITYEGVVLRCRGNDNDIATVPYTLAIEHSGFVCKVLRDRERRHQNNNVVDIDAPPWFVWSPQTLNSIAQWMRSDKDGDSTLDHDDNNVVEIAKAADYLDMADLIAACAKTLAPRLCEYPENWKPEFAGLLQNYERICAAIVDAADVSQLSIERLQELQQGFQNIDGSASTHPILRRIDTLNMRNPGRDIMGLMPHLRSLRVLNILIEKQERCCDEPRDIHRTGVTSKKSCWCGYEVKHIIEESLPSTVHTLGIYEKHCCGLDKYKKRSGCASCRSSSRIKRIIDLADKTHIRDFTHWNECSYWACTSQIIGIRSFPTQLQHLCLRGVSTTAQFPISLTSLKLLRFNNRWANLSKLEHLAFLQFELHWSDDRSRCISCFPLPPNISKLHFSGNSCTRINWSWFSHLTIRELHLEGITLVSFRDMEQMRLLIAKLSNKLKSLSFKDNHCCLCDLFFNNSLVIFPRVTTLNLAFSTSHYHDFPLASVYPSLRKLRLSVTTPVSIISFVGTTNVTELEVEITSIVPLILSVDFRTVEHLSLVIRSAWVDWLGLPTKVTTLSIDLCLDDCASEKSRFPNYFEDGTFLQYFGNLTRLIIEQTNTTMKFLKNNVSAVQCVEIAQSLTCMLYFKSGMMLLLPKHVKRSTPCVKSNNPVKDLKCVFQSLDYTRCKLDNITIYVVHEE